MYNIIFLIPSKLDGPSARYIIDLSHQLLKYNHNIYLCSDDESHTVVKRGPLSIENIKTPRSLTGSHFKKLILHLESLKIDFVFCVGSRTKTDAIAISLKKLGAKLIKQFEDDEKTIFENCNKGIEIKDYDASLKKGYYHNLQTVTEEELENPKYKIVDPYLKGLTLAALDGYSKIWTGLKYEEEEYLRHLSPLSIPPICSPELINSMRDGSIGETDENLFFIGGSIYSTDDASVFLKAWKGFQTEHKNAKLIISRSRSSPTVVEEIKNHFDGTHNISLVDLPTDDEYQKVLSQAHFVVSVGGGEFDEKRLPSRLVKSMFLEKIILLPKAGFGESLSDMKNAIISTSNTEQSWQKTLRKAFRNRHFVTIGKNSYNFASENFDAANVARKFDNYLTQLDHEKTLNESIDIESCLKADYLSLLNNSTLFNAPQKISTIPIRFVISGDCLILQTMDRPDYNFQVDTTSKCLSEKYSKTALDSGFLRIGRANSLRLFDENYFVTISKTELQYLFGKFRSLFLSINTKQRSRLFDKLLISFRLFKLVRLLARKHKTRKIIFHADMQASEAIVSSLVKCMCNDIHTYTMQHAIFKEVKTETNVNIVNYTVSPSTSTLFWHKGTSELVKRFIKDKVALSISPFPSYTLSNIDQGLPNKDCLVILDGPDNKTANEHLFNFAFSLHKEGFFNEIEIKPHPNHNKMEIMKKIKRKRNISSVSKIRQGYKCVIFCSSTLGYEFSKYGYTVYQLTTNDNEYNESNNENTPEKFKSIEEFKSKVILTENKIESKEKKIFLDYKESLFRQLYDSAPYPDSFSRTTKT